MKKYVPGDKIMIKIGNRKIETYIDPHGTQRITPVNKLYNYLYECGKLDLNRLAVAVDTGQFKFKDYFELYLSIGYSVSGFSELSRFQKYQIKNPLWEQEWLETFKQEHESRT